ncbi:MAG: hypothetical protein K2W96_07655 [Gemmataceae bacterium]|nr:hypothetical protein [Gemmataceae bacterium]
MPGLDPAREYEQRRQDRQRRAQEFARSEGLLGLARLLAVGAVLLVLFLWLRVNQPPPWWLGLMVLGFIALLFVHDAVLRAGHRARRAVAYYAAGLQRLADDWKGKGQQGTRFLDEGHPYAADLDLFGPGSLFELLCTARTRTGEDTLAEWLKAGADPAEVRARQAAVAELRPMLDLREDLALLGSGLPHGVDYDGVAAWGEGPIHLRSPWPRWPALVLGLITTTFAVCWVMALAGLLDSDSFFAVNGFVPVGFMLAAQGLFLLPLLKPVNAVLSDVEQRGRDLGMLASVLERLEQASFASPKLRGLHEELTEGDGTGTPASQRIAGLGNLIGLLNSRRNQLFAPFAFTLMWGTQIAFAIEGWRARSGPHIRRWLRIVGQFEALCALAAYAYENPADPFPEIADAGPVLEAEGLGHPLMPRGKCVPNDVGLGGKLRVLVVSGSNMSGKSTFLRTIGINAALALAGAPVRARRMRVSPLAIGATLRIQDSLQAGRSRFFAEVLRVRQVVDLSRGAVPLLFLLDEIFAGTNSHDRCLGAEAVVAGLEKAGAVGLVTTHDLTLTRIADQLGERAENVHFADRFDQGTMEFDYTLRPGVVQNSNAIALMRAVGLEV